MKIYIVTGEGDCYDGYRSCPIIEYCNTKETAERYIKTRLSGIEDCYTIEEKEVITEVDL
jgi:hypothetical protein